jgi:shikimate kinase
MSAVNNRGKTMNEKNKHIILIGFKHVGKSSLGKHLSAKIKKPFIDLDREIEFLYETTRIHSENTGSRAKNMRGMTAPENDFGISTHQQFHSCREIMKLHGENYYRELENIALKHSLQNNSSVIALGGGTLLNPCNQEIIKTHTLIHVMAPRGIVFERIMVSGRPAFFDPNQDPYETFNQLWEERHRIYQSLTPYVIHNNESIELAVDQTITHLQNEHIPA